MEKFATIPKSKKKFIPVNILFCLGGRRQITHAIWVLQENQIMKWWCSLRRWHVVLFWTLIFRTIPCIEHDSIYVRIDIYCYVKTNYFAARNKHITNYNFSFLGKMPHCDTCSSLSAGHTPSTVKIVKTWKYHWRVSNTHIIKLTEAIVKWKKIIIVLYFFGKLFLICQASSENVDMAIVKVTQRSFTIRIVNVINFSNFTINSSFQRDNILNIK